MQRYSPSRDFKAHLTKHRQIHFTFQQAGQPLSEMDKVRHLTASVENDQEARSCIQMYFTAFPNLAGQNFNGLATRLETMMANRPPPTVAEFLGASTSSSTSASQLAEENDRLRRELQEIRNTLTTQRQPKASCWTHGPCGHESRQCVERAEGHKEEATFKNRMGADLEILTINESDRLLRRFPRELIQKSSWTPEPRRTISASVVFHRSDMRLICYSDASYLNETKARSRCGGYFYLGDANISMALFSPGAQSSALSPLRRRKVSWRPIHEHQGGCLPKKHSGGLCSHRHRQRFVFAVVNGTCKAKRSRAMNMRYHWLRDRVGQAQFEVVWCKGEVNVAAGRSGRY
jgi:hypothetical protein